MKILIVEDEKNISNAVKRVLERSNYTVDCVFDGEEALDFIRYTQYDCVILDVMIPKINGIDVVKTLRAEENNVPILMVTAKTQIDDKVLGLDAGADDYLTKPFSLKELQARIRSLTRRRENIIQTFTVGNITLDPKTYELSTPEKKVRLSSKEFQMIEMLINNFKMLISTESFMDKIWGYDSESEINVVWVYISSLRKKLKEIDSNVIIRSSRGLGYKLELIENAK